MAQHLQIGDDVRFVNASFASLGYLGSGFVLRSRGANGYYAVELCYKKLNRFGSPIKAVPASTHSERKNNGNLYRTRTRGVERYRT